MNFEPGEQSDDCDVICPHCGHRRQAESRDGDANSDEIAEDCDKCGKEFIRWAVMDITYHTRQP